MAIFIYSFLIKDSEHFTLKEKDYEIEERFDIICNYYCYYTFLRSIIFTTTSSTVAINSIWDNEPKDLAEMENSYRATLAQILGGIAVGIEIYFAW
jgi:hypothetical protein